MHLVACIQCIWYSIAHQMHLMQTATCGLMALVSCILMCTNLEILRLDHVRPHLLRALLEIYFIFCLIREH